MFGRCLRAIVLLLVVVTGSTGVLAHHAPRTEAPAVAHVGPQDQCAGVTLPC